MAATTAWIPRLHAVHTSTKKAAMNNNNLELKPDISFYSPVGGETDFARGNFGWSSQ